MAHHLISSNATIKAVKLGDAHGRLTDGAGLYLRLFVKGGSHGWSFDYSLNGRRNALSLGTYSNTGLSLARKKADEARKLAVPVSIPARRAERPATRRFNSGQRCDVPRPAFRRSIHSKP
jgi:hypothetical protein